MSNEYKEWYKDKMTETILDAKALDYITRIEGNKVYGFKGDKLLVYIVDFNIHTDKWEYELLKNDKIIYTDFELGYARGYGARSNQIKSLIETIQHLQNDIIYQTAELNSLRNY